MAKTSFLDKLAQRIQRVDKEELFHVLKDIAREKSALESVLQSLGDGILLLDLSGKILFCNRTAISLLGWGARQYAEATVASLSSDPSIAEIFTSDYAQSGQSAHREVQVYSPRPMLLAMDFLPMRDEKADTQGVAVILRDIGEKRRMEGRMVQSEKLGALSFLAAGLAHEIGNPLNSINIHLQLIDREIKKLKGARQIKKLTATVQEEIKRLDDIVHGFLSAIRPLKPKFEMQNINNILREVCRFLKHELGRQQIQCEMKLDDTVAQTLLDAAHLKQALINVFKNAMQAMPKGGTLKIVTAMQDSAIRVRIADNGRGIAPEHLSKIFDPYFTTRENGSGLGLMMTQRIIKEHGGDIEVKSEPGKGTEFVLTLPVRSTQPKMISAKIHSSRPRASGFNQAEA